MDGTSFFLLPSRCDALGAGMLIAVAYRNKTWWTRFSRVAPWGLSISILGAFIMRGITGRYTISAALYGFLIICALASPLSRFFTSAPMRALGNISYSMYMLHHIVMRYCFYFLLHRDPAIRSFGDITPCVVALPIVLGACAASWRWFEKPIMQYGHRHKYAKPIQIAVAV
jgi:peptidoglycan/LPS O-acetylase OafA/YrhL